MTLTSCDLFSFSTLVRAFRKRRCLTQQQLAEAVGVHRSAVIRWERGDYLPELKATVLDLARHLRLDDQETRQLLEASLTALTPHWSVPYPRNPFFTGREEVLNALHTQLGVEQEGVLTRSSALSGLGGVGKTQIALEYAYRYSLEYSAVFWIGAETEEQIVSNLLRVASVLQLPQRTEQDQQRVVAAVQRWLSAHNQWLLIWDNVENLALLDRFLPSIRHGAMLITTRHQTLGTLTQSMELSSMDEEEAMLFLLRRAKRLRPEANNEQVRQFAQRLPVEYAAAAELLRIMDRLTLALDQAGAYIEETECGFSGYLRRYEQQHMRLLDRRGVLGGDHPHSVATTFRLASECVEQEQGAADLLRVCAFLHVEAIPEELFVEGAAHLGPTLASLASDPFQFDRAIATLRSLSLLQRQPETRTLSLHRLVQTVIRAQMSEQEQNMWIRRMGAALAAIFPRVTSQVWEQCERLLPHVLAIEMAMLDQAGTRELARVLRKTADYLRDRAQYEQAEPLYQRALRILESEQGSECWSELAYTLNNLAILYFVRGQYERAEPLYRRSLHIQEQAIGLEHPSVVRPLVNLALICKVLGKYEQAESLYQQALHILEQAFGPEHPELARSVYNLALLYSEQGKDKQAELLYQRALRILEQAGKREHPDIAYPLCELATLALKQGQYERAEPLYQRTLHIREQALGQEHPLVTYPLHGLALLFLEQNRYAEAESLLLRVLSTREQHLGPEHPETATALHDLAVLRQKQGNLDEAISLAERARSIRLQTLGNAHPQTAATRELYAHLVQEQECAAVEIAPECCTETAPDLRENRHHQDGASFPLYKAGVPTPSEDDPLQKFLDARCELHPRAWCRSADLWQNYEQWSREHQERYSLSRAAFSQQLKAHGCCTDRTKTTRIWRGIALIKTGDDSE